MTQQLDDDTCSWPRCREPAILIWLDYGLCYFHWDKVIAQQNSGKSNVEIKKRLRRRYAQRQEE